MTPAQFVAKWSRAELSERAASQEHFIDLCRLLGQPTPAEHDATGAEYTFEKGISVSGGESRGGKGDGGFADVWWRGKFGWEYKRKGKYKDLSEAYRQLCQYREALDNPPLLIVSDIARTEIHTNFTGTAKQVHSIALKDLDKPESLSLLRRAFTEPESFKPTVTPEKVTEEVAGHIAQLARSLQSRGHEAHAAAHFLMKCMFCLFAEDVELLPEKLFSRLLTQWHDQPKQLTAVLTDLFAKMRTGGPFGYERIERFNGGLFDEAPALPLTYDEIGLLAIASEKNWGSVEPAIFGTLFERSLDPDKRAQIGAHYTSREDILLIVEPVVMAPLRKQWQQAQADVEGLLQRRRGARTPAAKKKADAAIADALAAFLHRLGSIRILDPACGSGNFLYVAIQQLLNLEKEVITFAARGDIALGLFPTVRPTQLHGLEINPYAAELAQVVIWIGYLQWMRDNGFNAPRDPILEPLATIECRDAILDLSDPKLPVAAAWPVADFIIGNPPFLGSKVFRKNGLSDDYVAAMYAAYDLPKTSDLCCYWFERARQVIETAKAAAGRACNCVARGIPHAEPSLREEPACPTNCPRVGLLATQGIRGGDNRTVLERIKKTGDIFMAWSDREWILDGAAVHVSMVGFDDGTETSRKLDGKLTKEVFADLTTGSDLSGARTMCENSGMSFMGNTKQGLFEIDWDNAKELLELPNPNGRDNFAVVRPWRNGKDITQRNRGMWIIDFPPTMLEKDATEYEGPFKHIEACVKPWRLKNHKSWFRPEWWVHYAPRPELKQAVAGLSRFPVTPRVAKHRLFVWSDSVTVPDCQVIAFARSDDYFFGVLHSSIHELWALRQGTQLETRPRYTPTTCFETFPLPWPPGKESADDPLCKGIAAAAAELNEMRERWLNPPEWIDPIAKAIDAADSFADVPAEARALIRQSAIMAAAAKDANLKKRTLTNLYNERPTWLKLAHRKLDSAVLAAYATIDPQGQWSPAWAEAWQDSGASQPLPAGHPLAARRAEVDQMVLANLLRLNLARSGG